MKSIIHGAFKKFGVDIRRSPTHLLRNRIKLLNQRNVKVLVDVGANIGQYAQEMRSIGYIDKIVSFEPIKEAYAKLSVASSTDPNWDAFNMGLGDEEVELDMNIANNSSSSSLLEMNQNHKRAAPKIGFIDQERIKITTLDSFLERNPQVMSPNIFLKVDTQGYEMNVLQGSKNSLKFISGIQLEMSLFEVYDGETLFYDMITYLKEKGFRLYSLEPGLFNRTTGQLLQVDGIFFKD